MDGEDEEEMMPPQPPDPEAVIVDIQLEDADDDFEVQEEEGDDIAIPVAYADDDMEYMSDSDFEDAEEEDDDDEALMIDMSDDDMQDEEDTNGLNVPSGYSPLSMLTTQDLEQLVESAANPPDPPGPAIFVVDEDPQEESGICRLLPDELLLQILKHLSLFQLFETSLTCKRFCRLAREKSLRRGATISVEGFRSHQNYDPLIRLQKGTSSQKKMLVGPCQMKSLFDVYSREVDTLTMRNCVIYSAEDAVSLLHRLQRVTNLVLVNIDLTCPATQKVFLHCFDQLQRKGQLHLKSVRLGSATVDSSKLLDITSILPFVESVDLGTFMFNRGYHNLDRLGFVQAMLELPRERRKIHSLTMNSTSARDGEDIGRLASVIPLIRFVDLKQSNFSERSLCAIAEAIKSCSAEDQTLETVRYMNVSFSPEEFVRRYKATRMAHVMGFN